MRKFEEKDYMVLVPFEDKMKSAIESKYVTGMTKSSLDIFATIYREVFGRRANTSCSGCVLQMLQFIGNYYFGFKNTKEEQEKQEKQKKDNGTRSKRTIKDSSRSDIKGKSDNIDA